MEARRALAARGGCSVSDSIKALVWMCRELVLGKPLPAGEGRAVLPKQALTQNAAVKILPQPESQVTVAWVQLLQRLI